MRGITCIRGVNDISYKFIFNNLIGLPRSKLAESGGNGNGHPVPETLKLLPSTPQIQASLVLFSNGG